MLDLDPLSDLLRILRVNGALVVNDTYQHPWAVAVPDSTKLAQLAGLSPTDRAVAFHFVQHGDLTLVDHDGVRVDAQQGDLLIAFGGAPHQICSESGGSIVSLETLINFGHLAEPADDSDAKSTRLLCGIFSLGSGENSPLTGTLPGVTHIRHGTAAPVDALTSMLAREVTDRQPGSEFAMSRILELLCAEALRQIATSLNSEEPGWLHAFSDSAVMSAMTAIHRDPGFGWSVRSLADCAALSPSRLTARFRTALGESPMSYVARWRMILAGQLLIDSTTQIQRISIQVGYTSQPSFSRAFHRFHGCSPRQFRSNHSGPPHTTKSRVDVGDPSARTSGAR